MPTLVLSVLLDDDLLALNRAIGIIRRRNLAIASLSLGPAPRIGVSRLTCVVGSDPATVERLANQLRKMIGVREVLVRPEAECTTREHLLVRVRLTPAHLSELLDVASLYEARVIEESPEELVLEATGASPLLVSLLRALEPFGVIEAVRGGALALPRTPAPLPAAEAGAAPRIPTAISA